MTELHLQILHQIANTYNNVLNNNLNDTMKFLTVISILMTVPDIVTGFFGMNVQIPFTEHAHGWGDCFRHYCRNLDISYCYIGSSYEKSSRRGNWHFDIVALRRQQTFGSCLKFEPWSQILPVIEAITGFYYFRHKKILSSCFLLCNKRSFNW